jgi:uncharacterized membrane protein YfcA
MLEFYRKTLLRVQIFILFVCLVLWWQAKVPPVGVAVFLGVMEVGAVIGAWWGARLKRKVDDRLGVLPLKNR